MSSVIVTILAIILAQAHSKKSLDKLVTKFVKELFDRSLSEVHLRCMDMDTTTLGKPGHLARSSCLPHQHQVFATRTGVTNIMTHGLSKRQFGRPPAKFAEAEAAVAALDVAFHGGRATSRPRRGTVVRSLRNIDLPEVVFVDEWVVFGPDLVEQVEAATQNDPSQDADRKFASAFAAATPGDDVVKFIADCRDAGALIAVASRLGEEAASAIAAAIKADAFFFGKGKEELFANALEKLEVKPRGFGNAPADELPRPPQAKWCVTLEADNAGAVAARQIGMRCLGVGAVDVAEAHAHVESLADLCCEDIATPGIFWLQPLLPEGNTFSRGSPPGSAIPAMQASQAENASDGGSADDEGLRRILADLDPPS